RVLNPDSSPAPGVGVSVRSTHPLLGGFFNATSGAEGQYSVAGVPVGSFTATATDTGRQLQGETVGQISQDGQTVTADIQLVSNAINLPVNWYDANNFYFDVQGNGSVASGHNSVFAGDFGVNRGASLLDLIQGGNTNRFTAGSVGASEDGGREVAVRQTAVAGLNVTRKVFVPRDGYFARYLEVLENPTADGITVDVQVLSHYRPFFNNPRLIETSTGDNTLDVSDPANPDRWVVIDDGTDGDPFMVGGLPAVASVFDGPGASRRVDAASFVVVNGVGQLRLRWNSVTVPPGGSVMLMHFLVQQVNRVAGGEAGRRLVQLPPEALTGLSAAEIAAVGNFVVPPDGLGMVAPLPALNGRITGRVLAEDGTTPLPFGQVRFRSEHPLFGRVHFLNSDGNGVFQVSSRLGDFGDTVLVPVDRYAIEASHPTTGIATTNRFQFPTTPTLLTGNLSALIGAASASSFFPGWPPSRAIDDNLNTSWFTASGDAANRGTTPFLEVLLSQPAEVTQINIRGNRESATGFDFFRARIDVFGAGSGVLHSETVDLPAPVRDLDLDIPDQVGVQRVRFTGLADESADPGLAELVVLGTVGVTNRAQSDVIFNNTGGIAGTVRRPDGTPVGAACSIRISAPSLSVFFSSAADGTFVMNGLLPGNYTVTAFLNDPTGTPLTGTTNTAVAVGQATVQDVVLEPSGALEGTVVSASGAPANNVFLQLFNSGFSRSVQTDANGRYLFTNVRTGLFTLRVTEPGSQVSSNYAVTIVADQTNRQDIVLIGLGTIQLQVNFASGSPVPNLNVQLQTEARGPFFFFAGRTDSAGRLTLVNVPVGRFVVHTPHPSNGNVFTDTPGVITMNGDVVALTATLPGTGVVMGRVSLADGSPAAGSTVRLIHTNFTQQTSADSAGNYTVTQVPAERPFTLRAFLPGNSQIFRDVSNNIVPVDGATLTVDVTLPASATLRVTVLRSGGTPFAGARVNLRHAFRTSLTFVGVTDGSGVLSVANVPEGPFYVEARDPSSFVFAGSATGVIAMADQGRTVDVTITAPPLGTVQGTVLAGDGETPVPGAYIEIFDAASGQLLVTRGTDFNGVYRADGLASGAAGFRVVAHSPNRFEIAVEASGSITNTGDMLTLDLTLPISVVTGHVYYHDGVRPVPFPDVTATFTSTNGNQYSFGSSFTDENGRYRILDVEQGAAFTLNARDRESGLPGLATGLVETVSVPLTVDVVLLPSGTVAGVVEDAAMNPVPFAQVVLRSSSLDNTRFLQTDENGSFEFENVPVGEFILQACTFGGGKFTLAAGNLKPAGTGGGGNDGICGLTNGTVSLPDEVVNINVQLPPTATVQGTVYAADGTTPVPFAQVILQNFDHNGPLGYFETYREADENGQYPETRVPVGTVRVTASDPENFQSAGYVERAVGPNESAIVDVILGNAIRFDYRRIGADGFVYDINCNGELGDGGTEDGRLSDAYDGAYRLEVEDGGFPCFATGLLEEEGREVIIGPGGFGSIAITRKVFVPAS
ncbi:MAG TPA: carboxypeptidase regulatory-like domain-containing protein, partial [Methylomirabilota bacterium]|nr:carboxypeptidase regulatory-like domain-containing protein [Methylomirabilota bacterium]